jgi:hypothetical protein
MNTNKITEYVDTTFIEIKPKLGTTFSYGKNKKVKFGGKRKKSKPMNKKQLLNR